MLQPTLAILALATALSASVPREPQTRAIRVGDQPEHTFRLPLVNASWVDSLRSLRGKPALFDFWGTR